MHTDTAYLIGRLADAQALDLLRGIGQGYKLAADTGDPPDLGGLRQAIQAVQPEACDEADSFPDGEFARRVLLAAAHDTAVEKAVWSTAEGKSAEAFGGPLAIALVTAAIVVLNTHGYMRYKDGKWEINLTVRPLGKETLKALVSGIFRLLGR